MVGYEVNGEAAEWMLEAKRNRAPYHRDYCN